MKIILHGKLARELGRVHEIATAVPAEAIEGLSRQLENWPRDMLIDCVGFETEEALRSVTTDKAIHLVPSLRGGSGGFVKVVIGIAIIAAIVLTPGTWTALAVAVLMTGVSIAVSGMMQMFTKAPQLDMNKSNDPAASKYIGVQNNTTNAGTYRTLAWGRNRIAGHWLSLQVDSKTIVAGRFPVTPPA